MTAFNIVKCRVKEGLQEEFIKVNSEFEAGIPGRLRALLVKTGERDFCWIGEWESLGAMNAAMDTMIGHLDQVRHMLVELELSYVMYLYVCLPFSRSHFLHQKAPVNGNRRAHDTCGCVYWHSCENKV